jgi:hypothetical protein
VSFTRADFHALTTRYTSVGEVLDLGIGMSSFGVVAPETAHCTSLEKDRRADPGPVMDGESLYVGDDIFVHLDNGLLLQKPGIITHENILVGALHCNNLDVGFDILGRPDQYVEYA